MPLTTDWSLRAAPEGSKQTLPTAARGRDIMTQILVQSNWEVEREQVEMSEPRNGSSHLFNMNLRLVILVDAEENISE